MKLEAFLDLLACPQTGESLSPSATGTELVSPSGARYPLANGAPILLTPSDREEFTRILESEGRGMVEEYEASKVEEVTSSPTDAPPFPPLHLPRKIIHEAYELAGERTRILSVGGGPTRNNPKEINLNMGAFPNVDVVGNALRLPFQTGKVDGCWCNAVLEHVAGAPQAVEEMIRVTRPGGTIMLLVPFLQPVHSYPGDYQRYTAEGLKHLLRGQEILKAGEAVGASYTMHELLTIYLNNHGHATLPRWLRGICRRALLPALKKANIEGRDVIDNAHRTPLLSSLVYCIARKSQ